jgi:hypothetical protein
MVYGAGFWTFFDTLAGCAGTSSTCQTNAVKFVSNPSRLFCWNLNTRSVLNPVIVNGTVLATMNNNAGSWRRCSCSFDQLRALTAHVLRRTPWESLEASVIFLGGLFHCLLSSLLQDNVLYLILFHIHGFAIHNTMNIALSNKHILPIIFSHNERNVTAKNDTNVIASFRLYRH